MNPETAIRAASPKWSRRTVLLAFAVLIAASFACPISTFAQIQVTDPDLDQKLTIAEANHDLAILYIKKGDLDRALTSARMIIQLRFPAEEESRIGKSLSIITEKFSEIQRYDLAQALLDEALKMTALDANKANLFKIKARLYLKAGDNERALEAWKKNLELEARRPRQN